MRLKNTFLTLTASVLLTSSAVTLVPTFNHVQVQAANYSSSEAKKVRQFQSDHKLLDSTVYNENNLYITRPHFGKPFNPGTLDPFYVQSSMDYINYYRSLFGLPYEQNPDTDSRNAQLGASVLAAVNAKTSLRAHGLLGYNRPSYISKEDWEKAENATLGNINFLESTNGATAGEIVTDLLQDQNNISGAGNTGHRALLLSARATHMGIGAAYGRNNGKFYSVENGVFADDILRTPVKDTVTYPSETVFPYELIDEDTPWSAYFSNRHISRTPKVYITDLTTKKKYRAKHVRNFGTDYYSNGYSAAISFNPGATKIVNTHKYKVQIGNYYTYSFRLFRQNSTLKTSSKKKTVRHHKKVVNKTKKVSHKRK